MSVTQLVPKDDVHRQFEARLQSGDLNLPLLPRVAAQVIELTSNEDANSQQLAKLIQGDQTLTGHVMRMANSAAFRPTSPFVSLQQAIARLGMLTISEIVLATSLNSKLFPLPARQDLLKKYWHDSLSISVWAREIARMRRTNVESSFLAGLLCQVGKPIVLQVLLEEKFVEPEDDVQIEHFVEHYKRMAGIILVNRWELPEVVSIVISDAVTDASEPYADTILNVEAAIELVENGCDVEALPDTLLTKLNFYPEDLAMLEDLKSTVNEWLGALSD
jgi:HD-like signal output (HDOD) protein